MTGDKASQPDFAAFARTYKQRAGSTPWIKTIPEYDLVVKIYNHGRGKYVDVDGVERKVTPAIIHRWLLARGYDPEICRYGRVKHWCDAQRAGDSE